MTIPSDVDRRFREAAAASGDLDVRYDVADTPVGPLIVAASERGLCRISFDPEPERFVDSVARTHGIRVLRVHGSVDPVRRQLDEYFDRRRHDFDLDFDLRVAPFHERVLAELARVPYGQVTTYGTLAAQVDAPRAARAVGTVMNRNPIPIVLPCHRVVGANGSLVGYGGGLDRKEQLLRLEGVTL
jgi:methylated-DNA-[protein]-cysteine S-methyltransferase